MQGYEKHAHTPRLDGLLHATPFAPCRYSAHAEILGKLFLFIFCLPLFCHMLERSSTFSGQMTNIKNALHDSGCSPTPALTGVSCSAFLLLAE
jgi:hypothetical protein